MDLGRLKDRFDNRIVFWGGLAVEMLLKGTVQEVRQNVRKALTVAKTRKVIILGSSHSIAYGVPYENSMAMLDEFQNHALL
jgi:uroporphyrinogen-III decarboxylase